MPDPQVQFSERPISLDCGRLTEIRCAAPSTSGGKVRAAAILLVLLLEASPLRAHQAQRPPNHEASHLLQHQWAPEGLFGAMGNFVTDLGMHALHLLLSGPSNLLLDELSSPGEEGNESTGGDGRVCSRSGVDEGEMEGDLCGAQSSRVYCMEVAAMDFQEADMRQHILGSTCAPGGMRSVHDKLYSDYCFRRFPATRSVYFSDERCSLRPGVECGPL
ncbi:hypothetical protein COCOBI_07-6480 [Coccomyxa sp. Obi]|nr:hypothetical protein COCOBI_07-6480 [Coccomyxa sp. Obi]